MAADVRVLDRMLADHVAGDAAERHSIDRTRRLLRWLPSPLDQRADPTHVTGSAIVLGDDGRVALHRHKRLGIWLQPGGHLDAPETPAQAALREAEEETGLAVRHPPTGPLLVHVDVHQGPRGHVHLDLRYLLHARAGAAFAPGETESQAVQWFTIAHALDLADRSLAAALQSTARRLRRAVRPQLR